MASFVYAVWSITNIASVHCSVRPEISPCTCEPIYASNHVELSCEKVDSFHQIVDALSNKFEPNISISLKIAYSQLDDLEMRSFTDMNLNVRKLRLNSNNLRSVPELPFRGLSNIEFLSFGDNLLDEIPKHVLNHLPKIKTLDLGRGHIRSVQQDDFKGIQRVKFLFLPSNNITRIDKGAFPTSLYSLHVGDNQISHLNGTLSDLDNLEFLFINVNNITTLEGQLPKSQNLKIILAQNNSLEALPQSMKDMHKLETIHLQNNKLRSFDSVFRNGKSLTFIKAFHNQIEYLSEDEFLEAEYVEDLDLANNKLKSLNNSLLPMKRLKSANFSLNEMEEFSMNEIRGLEYLKSFDISYNRIAKLTGRQENTIDQQSFLVEFQLHHNCLKSLDGALTGLNRLRILSLTHNQIEKLLPDDFIGLENLEILDLSYNHLLSLEEMSTTFLPSLKILKVGFNNLTTLQKDFHGLPILCQANLMNNQIRHISPDLVTNTRCSNHGVPGTLELWLENNPIMCDESLNQLCPLMLTQEARIRGKSQCYESDREVCADLPIILQAPLSQNLPLIIHQQVAASNPKSLVQVIVPSILLAKPLKKQDDFLQPLNQSMIKIITTSTLAPTTTSHAEAAPTTTTATTITTTPTTTTTTTTTTTVPSSTTTNTAAAATTTVTTSTSTMTPILTPPPPQLIPAIVLDIVSPGQSSSDIQTEYPTVEYISNIDDKPVNQFKNLPETLRDGHADDSEDNSVPDELPPVVITDIENTQRLQIQDEPPEIP